MTILRSRVIGLGSYVPERRVTNDDLAKLVDTSDEWIVERTGIRSRFFGDENLSSSIQAIRAAQNALDMAGLKGDDIDLIVLGTATADKTFPATAAYVQAAIGMTHGAAFDVVAACSGFIYSLEMADNMLRLGKAKTALVIGVETFSKILDFTDRNTCVLFGDGAGAAVIRSEEAAGEITDKGILDLQIRSDGRYAPELCSTGGPSTNYIVGRISMNGREVFRHAVTNMAEISAEILQKNNLSLDDVSWLIPHQANMRILDATAKKLGIPTEKVIATVDHHANTSAASIPLALDESYRKGKIKDGDLLLLTAMGAGFTWGAGLIRL